MDLRQKQAVAASVAVLGAFIGGCSENPNPNGNLHLPPPGKVAKNQILYSEKPAAWVDNGDGIYLFHSNDALRQNLRNFVAGNPDLSIVDLSKSQNRIVVLTRPKDTEQFGPSTIVEMEFDASWPVSLRDYIKKNPQQRVTATFLYEEIEGHVFLQGKTLISNSFDVQTMFVITEPLKSLENAADLVPKEILE